MNRFRYVAAGSDGRESAGVVESLDERDAVARLTRQGLFPIEVQPASGDEPAPAASQAAKPAQRRLLGFGGASEKDVTDFTRQMATFLKAGFPLARALSFVQEHATKPAMREMVGTIYVFVRDGGKLSAALQAHPKQFSDMYLSMVAAGEESGKMALMFERLAELRERSAELKAEIIGAMTYPAIMVFAMVGSILVLLTFVVPRFASMFDDLGGELPLPTQILMSAAGVLRGYWWAFLLAAVAAWMGLRQLRKTPQGRIAFERVYFRVPVLGQLAVRASMARFCRTLATLMESGVNLLRALECVRDVTGSQTAASAIGKSLSDIREGKPLADTIASTKAFPEDLVEMIRVGEESARVPEMLARVAETYERKVTAMVKGFIRMLEPIMILVMGVVIGGIVMAMLLPMFQMNLMAR